MSPKIVLPRRCFYLDKIFKFVLFSSFPGTLYITFDVAFPKGELSEADKKQLIELLNQKSSNSVYNGLNTNVKR